MTKQTYIAPEMTVCHLWTEHQILASAQWYEQEGRGDFDYGTETDEAWG